MIMIEQQQNPSFPIITNYYLRCPKCKYKNFWLKKHWKIKCKKCERILPRHDKLLFDPNVRLQWHLFNNWMVY